MTVNDIFEQSMSLMDERTETGVVDAEATLTYQKNAPYILAMLQNELLEMGDYFNTYEFTRNPISPLLGKFGISQHDDVDVSEDCTGSAKAYYLEVDAPCTVYIEDYDGSSWNTLETITVPSTVSNFTAYSGVVIPTTGATNSRIRFSGNYYYNYRNIALYKESFESASNVPDYREYVKYEMPSDFSSTAQIVKEDTDYDRLTNFRWEGQGDLYIPYNFQGNIRIVYRPIPNALVDLTSEISLDDNVGNAILPYGLARELLVKEDKASSNYFGQRYDELKFTLRKPRPKGSFARIDEYDASLSC